MSIAIIGLIGLVILSTLNVYLFVHRLTSDKQAAASASAAVGCFLVMLYSLAVMITIGGF